MIYNYQGGQVSFSYRKKKADKVLVFLHGWGRGSEDFSSIADFFKEYSILQVDFPPFGKSSFFTPFKSIFSYANMLISLCAHLKIERADFVAHSFGGRVLILIAALNPSLVHKCIFTGAAGLKPKRGVKYRVKVLRYKLCKKFGRQAKGGSKDYLALPQQMRGLFNNIVNTHLDEFCPLIKAPTLLIWGDCDSETPLYMGRRMNKLIKDSRLEVLQGCGHFAFLENSFEFCLIARDFLKER